MGSDDDMSTVSTPRTAVRISVDTVDHLVLTVRDRAATLAFYVDLLGMTARQFGEGRLALHFGDQKLNIHVAGEEIAPHAQQPTPGSADLCFITSTPVEGVVRACEDAGVAIEQGPVQRVGATGDLLSVYLRDPDGNLVELANRITA
jgi:catechol 2,3-dioxygenase-like lactoylglutathione lyase family enzyme